jgi:SpoVK/Ycf46/Vps4 family AAA+-type ATPase
MNVCGQAFPTYWINVGALFGKYVGESEANLEELLAKLNAHSGCITIWDEFEKVLAMQSSGGSNDSGVTTRLIGRLLNWMSEEKKDTYFVATMNSTQGVPPEFFRRFDASFYTSLPDSSLRREIIEVHMRKRNAVSPLSADQWGELVASCDRFVGSELEDIVIMARSIAFADRAAGVPTFEELMTASQKRSQAIISKIHKEQLEATETFCKLNAIPVYTPKVEDAVSTPRRRNSSRAIHTDN